MTTIATGPVRLVGQAEPGLSRWLWLVKWLLLVPHIVVLLFLWIAAAVLSVVAWFAILFRGSYPRRIFTFNLGVMRWTWRVLFYGYSALGTDRYPPFSLGAHEDYPAVLDVIYPERLSRGLVLVKSWLLLIPHYLDVGLLKRDPFVALDRAGVGALLRIAVEKGRAVKTKLKVGICGEHGGEPTSVEFCHVEGFDYVSCSPFRVPIARVAAARAALRGEARSK